MLARVANNLFWMGRYIERAEHIARYMNVNYFNSLDAPNDLSQSRQFVLRSMLFMTGEPVHDDTVILKENKVLYDIALNKEKPFSIINCVKNARENAKSARDLISTELYEALNKFYHYVIEYPEDFFLKNGLFEFTVSITESTDILRGKIRGTLLHDQVYAIIMMGINIERATQIIRIINTKFNDAAACVNHYDNTISDSHEWSTLLKCAESYDMMRRYYKKAPTNITTLEFLILNPDCPRSVMNSLNQVFRHIQVINKDKHFSKNSAAFYIGKVRAQYKYMLIQEIEENPQVFIESILSSLTKIGEKIEGEYFTY
ncbi:alpha-E domain-containing protein [Ascidiimonas sp. W6]|uniref:alpha-E domain-containing protein n=1 Tax=Ascidiimonas meishanensis TaxID=3128903 RepID=UPI0030EE0AFC